MAKQIPFDEIVKKLNTIKRYDPFSARHGGNSQRKPATKTRDSPYQRKRWKKSALMKWISTRWVTSLGYIGRGPHLIAMDVQHRYRMVSVTSKLGISTRRRYGKRQIIGGRYRRKAAWPLRCSGVKSSKIGSGRSVPPLVTGLFRERL